MVPRQVSVGPDLRLVDRLVLVARMDLHRPDSCPMDPLPDLWEAHHLQELWVRMGHRHSLPTDPLEDSHHQCSDLASDRMRALDRMAHLLSHLMAISADPLHPNLHTGRLQVQVRRPHPVVSIQIASV